MCKGVPLIKEFINYIITSLVFKKEVKCIKTGPPPIHIQNTLICVFNLIEMFISSSWFYTKLPLCLIDIKSLKFTALLENQLYSRMHSYLLNLIRWSRKEHHFSFWLLFYFNSVLANYRFKNSRENCILLFAIAFHDSSHQEPFLD